MACKGPCGERTIQRLSLEKFVSFVVLFPARIICAGSSLLRSVCLHALLRRDVGRHPRVGPRSTLPCHQRPHEKIFKINIEPTPSRSGHRTKAATQPILHNQVMPSSTDLPAHTHFTRDSYRRRLSSAVKERQFCRHVRRTGVLLCGEATQKP